MNPYEPPSAELTATNKFSTRILLGVRMIGWSYTLLLLVVMTEMLWDTLNGKFVITTEHYEFFFILCAPSLGYIVAEWGNKLAYAVWRLVHVSLILFLLKPVVRDLGNGRVPDAIGWVLLGVLLTSLIIDEYIYRKHLPQV